jgi:hypothetical protein
VSIAFWAAVLGVKNNSSLMTPLLCGKSRAKTLDFRDAVSGSETATPSQVEARCDSGRQIEQQL